MDEETILTLYIDPDSYEKLQKDHEFYNPNQRISRTIKRIVLNHYTSYTKEWEDLKKHILSSLEDVTGDADLTDYECNQVAWQITRYLGDSKSTKALNLNKKKGKKKKVNIRINKNSTEDSRLNIILQDKLPSDTLGELSAPEYFVSIIKSYLELPQVEREKVLYKNEVEELERAIRQKRMIRFRNKDNGTFHHVLPIAIGFSNEEIYDYLVYQTLDKHTDKLVARCIHIWKIDTVMVEPETQEIDEEVIAQYERMKKNGIQFSNIEDRVIKVKLSDLGVSLFKSNYIERPKELDSSDKEHNIYHFDCSNFQFFRYFANFYKEVTVLEPQDVKDEFITRHSEAISNYK